MDHGPFCWGEDEKSSAPPRQAGQPAPGPLSQACEEALIHLTIGIARVEVPGRARRADRTAAVADVQKIALQAADR